MPYLKLFCGKNRGIIFTLDATIASVVVILLIIVSSVYVSKSREEALPKLQMLNTGYDIMNIIAEKDLANPSQNIWNDEPAIRNIIDAFNPANYDFVAKYQCGSDIIWSNLAKDPDTSNYDIPTTETVVTGEYVYVKSAGYCRARFYIWLK